MAEVFRSYARGMGEATIYFLFCSFTEAYRPLLFCDHNPRLMPG
ncbi:MAG: hypothetical protein Q8941_02160 [Bacteroidota bacterium]|nr:hypothetical protein [Bacteroidota bacterium]